MKCISIPECTQRLSHLTSGGQHGQESEEGEEGEERSEEDCEEDPQGLEEEVSRLDLNAGGLLPARHLELTGTISSSSRKAPSDAKRVSARHQVKRLDRTSKRALAPFEADPAEEADFSSFGADGISVRNFTGAFAR